MIMSLLKKSVLASFVVQAALVLSGLILYCLPYQAGQNFVWMLFPFVVGVPLTSGSLLSGLSFAQGLPLMIALMLLTNFTVYTAIFYTGLTLRHKFRNGANYMGVRVG